MKRLLPAFSLIIILAVFVWSQTPIEADSSGENPASLDSIDVDSLALEDTLFIPPDTMVSIPGGEYMMGEKKDLPDQRPVHIVKLDSFYIDVHEVTNAQYGEFLDATGHRLPLFWDDSTYNQPQLPVTGVSWYDAAAYCEWAGKRLPTEAEWEAASRGGLEGENYPWEGRINEEKANYRVDPDEPPSGIKPVGQYPPNGYGLYDMAGNVWEWTADYYSPTAYADSSDWDNPGGPVKRSARVMRGGSWNYTERFLRCAYRNRAKPDMRNNYLGFRCAKG
ncbi:MAG: formylglycine-generating enzyme family protein [candidate division Zixibacteria bacterium]|nr:formylglycine-generating enzyme family protein [Candidatus Tariuqbacter arcticus]